MKQVLQNLKTGATEIVDVPCPSAKKGQLLIRSQLSLVSTGTERMLVEFGKAGWIEKARRQPDKVRMVLDKIKTDGLLPTLDAVQNKLDQPLLMGYCNVGTVLEAGSGTSGYAVGARIVSNGRHAEVVSVPTHLCAEIPDCVSDETAVFTVIGAIALQGIRLANPTLGESVVVTGLGLVGLMTVQLLRAQGCRVLGIDFDSERIALARQFGAECVDLSLGEDPPTAAERFSRGRGIDAILITATTKSNDPVSQGAKMCRKRGRIVLVGVTGLELSRADFYEKELSFQVSCSYGPGRYDPKYEEQGQDYPIGYVRWTEQRNMEAVLDMMASGVINVEPLISRRFAFDDVTEAYEFLVDGQPSLGILLTYAATQAAQTESTIASRVSLGPAVAVSAATPVVGFIGAGNYASRVLMPAFKQAGGRLKTVVSSTGVSGVFAGKKHGIEEAVADARQVFDDESINTVVIATRHDTHAEFVIEALECGQNVFVEKPLCLNDEELARITNAYRKIIETESSPLLMVGFNRRFSPHVRKIRDLLKTAGGPSAFVMTVNAGEIPADHWTQDPKTGGGRIVGEACHFIDLLRFLADAQIRSHQVTWLRPIAGLDRKDNAMINLGFADGSVGTIHYLANGNRKFPKERLEVFSGGRILQLDNFRKLKAFNWPGFSRMNLGRQDKGQRTCVNAFLDAIREGESSPIPIDEILEVSRVTLDIAKSP